MRKLSFFVILLLATVNLTTAADWRSQCLTIGTTKVKAVIDPAHGGRITSFSLNGKNIIYEIPNQPDWIYPENKDYFGPAGGRFDIGPEILVKPHPELWDKAWKVTKTEPNRVVMTSGKDQANGLELQREIVIDPAQAVLRCTQTMTNISSTVKYYNYWGRTMVTGGGICLIPLTPGSSYPNQYATSSGWPDYNLISKPQDQNVTIIDNFMVIPRAPQTNKLGWDSQAGWMAYIARNNLMLMKRFPIFPNRKYGEIGGLTLAIWFYNNQACELEPIGPLEELQPGASAAFTEEWQLTEFTYPKKEVNSQLLNEITSRYKQWTQEKAR